MAKVNVSARINEKVKAQTDILCKKKQVTFSKLVEVALIHELNKQDDNGVLAELEDIQEYIQNKINDLTPATVDVEPIEIKGVEYHIEELKNLHNMFGYISVDVVESHAKQLGVPFEEFIQVLNKNEFEFRIQ